MSPGIQVPGRRLILDRRIPAGRPGRRLWLAAVGLAVCLPPGTTLAARLRSLQSGSASLTGTSTTVNITEVDTARSFLVFGASLSENQPQTGQVAGRLDSPTTVTFTRWASGSPITLHWYVAEFASGVSVRRGQATFTNGDPCASPCSPPATQNAPLSPAVDTARSFPLVSYLCDGVIFDRNDWVQASITSGTNLALSMTDTVDNGFVEWQVVEYADAAVQTGTVSFADGDLARTATPTGVDPGKSWLIYSYLSQSGATADIAQKLVRGQVTDATTLTFDRSSNGQTIELVWYLVEFSDGTTVQRGTEPFAISETERDVPLAAVDVLRTIALGGDAARGGGSTYTGDDNPGVGWFTFALTAATNLRIVRGLTGTSSADAGWFVVSFPARRLLQWTRRDPAGSAGGLRAAAR